MKEVQCSGGLTKNCTYIFEKFTAYPLESLEDRNYVNVFISEFSDYFSMNTFPVEDLRMGHIDANTAPVALTLHVRNPPQTPQRGRSLPCFLRCAHWPFVKQDHRH